MILFLAIATVLSPAPACQPVEGDRIAARDLAKIEPAFSALPADLRIGFAPVPGARRTVSAVQIARLAREYGIDAGPYRDLCFEYATVPLDAGQVIAAMRKSLPEAAIEIVETSRFPVPSGKLEFPASWLGGGPGGTRLWRGEIRYGGNKAAHVWARVRIALETTQVVAVRDLRAGKSIEPSDVTLQKITGAPSAEKSVATVEDAVGRKTRRTLRAGQPIAAPLLAAARDIEAGETVHVEVAVGSAKLRLDAVAETGGATGSRIVLKNPANGRRFLARIEGKGKVAVTGPAEEKKK